MARIFSFFDDWKTAVLTCPSCGWRGCFDDGSIGYFGELMDCSCPRCEGPDDPMLAIVSYPTLGEYEEHFDELSDEEKDEVQKLRERHDSYHASCLRSPDQLPELSGDQLVILWDIGHSDDGSEETIIRHGEQIIWSEPVVWEGEERFREVLRILQKKYGTRLADLSPTDASWLYLLGDSLTAADRIEAVRSGLRS